MHHAWLYGTQSTVTISFASEWYIIHDLDVNIKLSIMSWKAYDAHVHNMVAAVGLF